METENESKFFKEFCCKRKQRIEVIDVEGIRGKRKCVIFKLGQIANREGNFGDEIEKELPSMSLIGKKGHSITIWVARMTLDRNWIVCDTREKTEYYGYKCLQVDRFSVECLWNFSSNCFSFLSELRSKV